MNSNRAARPAILALAVALAVPAGAMAQGVLRRSSKADAVATGSQARCELVKGDTLDFGDYTPGQAMSLLGSATVVARCDRNNTTMSISAGPSLNTGSIMNRTLGQAGGHDELRYQLYIDASHVTIWGDGVHGGKPLQRVVPTSNQTFTFYGEIGAGQSVGIGAYTDQVRIIVMP